MTTKAKDLKHLREVLTEAYPREELSLDALARVVNALTPLNFDQLQRVMSQHFGGRELTADEADSAEAFARAVERAHGICDA